MPTPYGSQGGMAFGADELRVLRRALALALHPSPVPAQDVQDCFRLASSIDEAVRESGRLRAFLHADLARYRKCLPGSAGGYLELLRDVLTTGYRPRPDDLAALRTLRGNPLAVALLAHCESLTPGRRAAEGPVPAATPAPTPVPAVIPAPAAEARGAVRDREPVSAGSPRVRLWALPGGRAADAEPAPSRPGNPADRPGPRPVPTPAEVFPPKRRPEAPAEKRAG